LQFFAIENSKAHLYLKESPVPIGILHAPKRLVGRRTDRGWWLDSALKLSTAPTATRKRSCQARSGARTRQAEQLWLFGRCPAAKSAARSGRAPRRLDPELIDFTSEMLCGAEFFAILAALIKASSAACFLRNTLRKSLKPGCV
jgi:hypothetical protein